MRGLPSFALVGAIGFIIDASVLSALMHFAGWTAWQGRILSFLTAVLITWALNRRYTFPGRGPRQASVEALAYGAIQVCGAGINLAIFALCLLALPGLEALPVVPLAIGAIAALLFNFAVSKTLLYSGLRSIRGG